MTVCCHGFPFEMQLSLKNSPFNYTSQFSQKHEIIPCCTECESWTVSFLCSWFRVYFPISEVGSSTWNTTIYLFKWQNGCQTPKAQPKSTHEFYFVQFLRTGEEITHFNLLIFIKYCGWKHGVFKCLLHEDVVDTTEVLATRDGWIFNLVLSDWVFCGGDPEKFPKLIKEPSNMIKLCLVRHRKSSLISALHSSWEGELLCLKPFPAQQCLLGSGCSVTLIKWDHWHPLENYPAQVNILEGWDSHSVLSGLSLVHTTKSLSYLLSCWQPEEGQGTEKKIEGIVLWWFIMEMAGEIFLSS